MKNPRPINKRKLSDCQFLGIFSGKSWFDPISMKEIYRNNFYVVGKYMDYGGDYYFEGKTTIAMVNTLKLAKEIYKKYE